MAMEKFHYSVDTGKMRAGKPVKKDIVLPRFASVPFGIVRKNRKLPPEEQIFAMLEEILGEEDLELLDTIGQKEVSEMVQAWQTDSGVELGES